MSEPRAILHCNAGGTYGMGHLMRVIAVAEEALGRNWQITIAGDLDIRAQALVAEYCPGATCVTIELAAVPSWLSAAAASASVVHLDSYWISPEELPSDAGLLSSVQDGTFGQRPADLAIDPNLGAESRLGDRESRNYLLGIDAVAIRRQVLRRQWSARGDGRRVLVVLGGTDPHGATAEVVEALGIIPRALEVMVVAPPALEATVSRAAENSPHAVSVVSFLHDLPAVASEHDVVVTAAGTSVWDFACMGVPMALVWVADNQEVGYEAVVGRGLGVGLGRAPDPGLRERMMALDELLRDTARRDGMAAAGRELVDGLGTWRIVSAWEQLLALGPKAPAQRLSARPATLDDAHTLFAWRNDPVTRGSSRNTGELRWDEHVAWLSATFARADRELLIVEDAGSPVGTVRWDEVGVDAWEVSITVAPEARGGGLALAVLQAGERLLGATSPARLIAAVHQENEGSRRLFARAGYLPHLPVNDDGFLTFARWRLP